MCIHADPTVWGLACFKTRLVSTQSAGRANTQTRKGPFVLCNSHCDFSIENRPSKLMKVGAWELFSITAVPGRILREKPGPVAHAQE